MAVLDGEQHLEDLASKYMMKSPATMAMKRMSRDNNKPHANLLPVAVAPNFAATENPGVVQQKNR